ncbi:MAG TPA: DUF5103 domain-containing protein, partial [Cytophagales bacterium]|nr:DUF5103 domain-containing protein [Cytophagales bacterium]
PHTGQLTDMFVAPIISLAQSQVLLLKFDEIGDEYHNYYAKIINCDASWKQTTLQDLQFLNVYNEFNFSQYSYATNTLEKYIHYTFQLPKVKISGNYVLVVYREGDISDVVLTRRFVIFENLVNVGVTMQYGTGEKRFTHQAVELVLSYPSFNIQNSNDVKVVIRQNGRWDNAKFNIKPLYYKEVDRVLDYRYFNNELAFPSGNEYRVFDTRSLVSSRLGIRDILVDAKSYEVFVMEDRPRRDVGYILTPDANGWFAIYRQETNDGTIDGDYCWVNFTLKSEKSDHPVYLFGKLTEWKIDPQYQMTYHEKEKAYKLRARFKQGYYNYEYVTLDPQSKVVNHSYIEGDFSQANNFYEVFIYYTPFGSRTDQLIGYRYIKMN